MPQIPWQKIHEKALQCAKQFKRSEAELLEILIEVESHRVWEHLELNSSFQYCTQVLGLSEDSAFNLIRVARKSKLVPQLKQAVLDANLNLSRAKKIASVITPQNQAMWIEKARQLPTKLLEKEVARVSPALSLPERVKAVCLNLNDLRCGISDEGENWVKRSQDILCQKNGKVVSLGETITLLANYFLDREDPIRKAERNLNKTIKNGVNQATETDKNISETKSLSAAGHTSAKREIISLLPRNSEDKSSSSLSSSSNSTPLTGLRPVKTTNRIPKENYSAGNSSLGSRSKRAYTPASVTHAVSLRDQQRCQHIIPGLGLCGSQRWVQRHHRVFVKNGGENSVQNFITLCGNHHRLLHRKEVR